VCDAHLPAWSTHLRLEPGAWRNAARAREHLGPLRRVPIEQQTADIVACLADVQDLLERLDTGDDGFPRLTKADDLDLVAGGGVP
jgi:hypothetical protein